MNKNTFKAMFRRRIIMALLLLLQIAIFVFVIIASGSAWRFISVALQLFSIFVMLHVVTRTDNVPFKTMWLAVTLIVPLFGGVLYLWSRTSTHSLASRLKIIDERSKRLLRAEGIVPCEPPEDCTASRYLRGRGGFPAYSNTRTEYLSPGEKFFDSLIPALESAEKYIFLEFFIIQDGFMWGKILDILKRKAALGVDVRIIYDDVGCFLRLAKTYPEQLAKYGIKCHIFNPFRPFLSAVQNNRDHRKIISVDGRTAFTGGLNIADEYINRKERFGYWKDCALRLDGDAAWSLTVIFLEMWRLIDKAPDDFESMRPKDASFEWQDGCVQPFADSPTDGEYIAAHTFLDIIYNAKKTLYINTPYLILDNVFIDALCTAAHSGVDVRIITPHHADKPIVHAATRSYYRDLLLSGVRIYEFSDGFMHSKTIAADGVTAVIGTSNFDYRSLYLHFECGVLLHGSQAVGQLCEDFAETLGMCQEMREEDFRRGLPGVILQSILRLISPLL